jgi:ElaB/YqjD/DUF883 family membrane-anchored ribosome-binding protein
MAPTKTVTTADDVSDQEAGSSAIEESKDDSFYGKARDARDKLNAVLTDLRVKARETEKVVRKNLAQAEKSVKHGVQHTETKIREYPLAAVGIAAGLGFIIGLLVNRNR